MPTKALFTGTFNPPTLGHLDLIKRAAALSDHLIIGVAEISHKAPAHFTLEERVVFLQEITHTLSNVEAVPFQGLAVDLAKEIGADCFIRGLRTPADLSYEQQMAAANLKLAGIETLFLLASPETSHVSSTVIREIAACGHDLSLFVPPALEQRIRSAFAK